MSVLLIGRHPFLRDNVALGTRVLSGGRLDVGAIDASAAAGQAYSAYTNSQGDSQYTDGIEYGKGLYTDAKSHPNHAGAIIGGSLGSVVFPGLGTLIGSALGGLIDSMLGDLEKYAQHVKDNFKVFGALVTPEVKWYTDTQIALAKALDKLTPEQRATFAKAANEICGPPMVWTGSSGHKNSQTGPWFIPKGGPSGSKLLGYTPKNQFFPENPPLLANDGAGEQTLDGACLEKPCPKGQECPVRDCVISGPKTVGLMGPMLYMFMGDDAVYSTDANHWQPQKAAARARDNATKVAAAIAGGLRAAGADKPKSGGGAAPIIIGLGLLGLLAALL